MHIIGTLLQIWNREIRGQVFADQCIEKGGYGISYQQKGLFDREISIGR